MNRLNGFAVLLTLGLLMLTAALASCGGSTTTVVSSPPQTVTQVTTAAAPAAPPATTATPAPAPQAQQSSQSPPNVVGLKLPEAKSQLQAAGYTVRTKNTDTAFGIVVPEHYTVCTQSEPQGNVITVLAQKYGC